MSCLGASHDIAFNCLVVTIDQWAIGSDLILVTIDQWAMGNDLILVTIDQGPGQVPHGDHGSAGECQLGVNGQFLSKTVTKSVNSCLKYRTDPRKCSKKEIENIQNFSKVRHVVLFLQPGRFEQTQAD